MKIKSFTKIKKDNAGEYSFTVQLGKGPSMREIDLVLNKKIVEEAQLRPVPAFGDNDYSKVIFRKHFLNVEGNKKILDEEDLLRIKHFVLKSERELEKITKEVEAFENFDMAQGAKRERIPGSVRLFVWQRDGGQCVQCGNKEKLEFDHIIPVVEGGSNTERNIQLLCENCNRSKGKKI